MLPCATCYQAVSDPVWHDDAAYHEQCLPPTWNSRRMALGPTSGNAFKVPGPDPGGRQVHHGCYPFDEDK